jgi:hypothetical protein
MDLSERCWKFVLKSALLPDSECYWPKWLCGLRTPLALAARPYCRQEVSMSNSITLSLLLYSCRVEFGEPDGRAIVPQQNKTDGCVLSEPLAL